MPAVAVPAIISLVGMGASAIGKSKAASAQKKADAARKNTIQGAADENYNNELAFQQANAGKLDSMYASAAGPQTSSGSQSSWGTSEGESEQTQDYGPEGNAARAGVLQSYQNQPWEIDNALAEIKAAGDRGIAGQQRSQRTLIGNRAARMGANAQDMMIGMDDGTKARLDNAANMAQQRYALKDKALEGTMNALQMFKSTKTKERSSQRGGGSSTSTSGPDLGAMMAVLNAQRLPKREAVV